MPGRLPYSYFRWVKIQDYNQMQGQLQNPPPAVVWQADTIPEEKKQRLEAGCKIPSIRNFLSGLFQLKAGFPDDPSKGHLILYLFQCRQWSLADLHAILVSIRIVARHAQSFRFLPD